MAAATIVHLRVLAEDTVSVFSLRTLVIICFLQGQQVWFPEISISVSNSGAKGQPV